MSDIKVISTVKIINHMDTSTEIKRAFIHLFSGHSEELDGHAGLDKTLDVAKKQGYTNNIEYVVQKAFDDLEINNFSISTIIEIAERIRRLIIDIDNDFIVSFLKHDRYIDYLSLSFTSYY